MWVEWRMRVLEDVFRGEMPEYASELTQLSEANEAFFRRNTLDGTLTSCFALDANGHIAGCGASCTLQELPSPDNPSGLVAYFMNIYVVPDMRGHGIGRQIVDWLISDSEKRGIRRMMLETTDAARALYGASGFRPASGYMIREELPADDR